jgi:hypothetical protein
MKLKLIILTTISALMMTACTDFTNPVSSEDDYNSGTNQNGSGASQNV